MVQDSESDDFSDSDYEEVDIENSGSDASKNLCDELSATSGRPSISPSPFRLTSWHFPDVIPATEKKSNPTTQCTLCSCKRDSRGKPNVGGRTGKILRPSSVALKSKNQEINRLQLAVKLPWAIFFESVDILS
ncbi:uncharacterized protein TNCV_1957891 [Trichonephila clavipes]|nr:uncharacterized protein TNCV_1957891 [Trichonephila clavipes]